MSKRYLRRLVEEGFVDGWDDPRMPTLSGLRRRGYTPEAIRTFCEKIGVAKTYSIVEYSFLEHCIREDLNRRADRVMVVLRPVKLVIDNYSADMVEEFEAQNNPEDPEAGTHKVPFSRELYIEAEDFMKDPVKGYFRLFPGNEVRLKYAYYVRCTGFETDENGSVTVVHAEYDPESRGGGTPTGERSEVTLGVRETRNRRAGETLRQPVYKRGARRRSGGRGFYGQYQSEFPRGLKRLQMRADTQTGEIPVTLPVFKTRLFLY